MPDLLNDDTSVSGNGRYRETAGIELLGLHTCVWRGFEFTTIGMPGQPLFSPELPASYRVTQDQRSWTGRRMAYRWRGGDLDVQLRTTLPGPLFATAGTSISLALAPGAEWRYFHDLEHDRGDTHLIDPHARNARLLHVPGSRVPCVIASSQPIRRIEVVSHRHVRFVFARPGARLLVVPLLTDRDVPRDAERRRAWLDLVARPPLRCSERFSERHTADGHEITITSSYPGARCAPIPTFLGLLGERDGLVRDAPQGLRLIHGTTGPYAVATGEQWRCRIASEWQHQHMVPSRAVRGELSPIPEELAYAGDATWEPGTAMDQCLSLRSFAPLVAVAPEAVQRELIPLLTPPDAKAFRDAVESIREPTSGLRWGQWWSMWAHKGDACYDPDWYNGLGLSGLARACESGVPELAEPARRTARACRKQRRELAAYATVFHDWSLCSAFSDPRGWMWNADCGHNLLEGVLAEARMREHIDGDRAGARHLRAVAARQTVGLRAAIDHPRWLDDLHHHLVSDQALDMRINRMTTWSTAEGVSARDDAPVVGTIGFSTLGSATWVTAATRNNYVLAGTFPEWNALLRDHLDRKRLRALVRDWDRNEQERYADWVTAYIGTDWKQRRAKGDQEARIQAAVFYHLAPEVALRRFAVGQPADRIEALWDTPLDLAQQLLLRSGMRLESW